MIGEASAKTLAQTGIGWRDGITAIAPSFGPQSVRSCREFLYMVERLPVESRQRTAAKVASGTSKAKPRPGRKSPPGGSARGAARREEILTGLMDRIAKLELRNPSLREIGRAIGIEPAHILYYFASREDLLQAVIMRWDADVRQSLGEGSDSLENLVATMRYNIAIPGVVRLYLNFSAEAVDPEHPAHSFFRERFDRVRTTLEARIRTEQANGTISNSIDPAVKARQLIALADGLQLQSLVNPTVNAADDLYEAIASLRVPDNHRMI